MKRIVLLFFSTFYLCGAQAQVPNFTMTPDTAVVDGKATFDDILQLEIQIKNSASTDRKFVWERTTMSTPFGWTSTVCDPIACRPSSTSTAEFDLKANESYTMLLDVSTDGAPGTGYYKLKLYEKGYPNQAFIGKYRYNATLVSTLDDSFAAQLSLYPNPAKDYFVLNSNVALSEVRLCGPEGRFLRSFAYAENGRYPIDHFGKGLYLVQLIGKDNIKMATKKLIIE